MSVRVLTERLVLEGKERAVFRMLKSMRKVAIDARGFVQSTAFRCEHEPQRIVVLSEWHDTSSVKSWLKNPKRVEIDDDIKENLFGPTTHRMLLPIKEDTFLL